MGVVSGLEDVLGGREWMLKRLPETLARRISSKLG